MAIRVTHMKRVAIGFAAAASAAAAIGYPQPHRPAPANVDQKRLDAADGDAANWMSYGRTYSEQRFSPLAGINGKTIGRLSLAWYTDFDTNRGQEATPLVVDGIMYVSTAWSKVYAIDAATGRTLWRYDPVVDPAKAVHACCDVVNRGVAVWKGRVFVGTIDGRLIALDAATGKPAWSTLTIDKALPYTITGAPRVFGDKVVIGNGGAEYGVRGYVTAYDTATGKKVWRFYTIPGDPAKGPDHEASDDALKSVAGNSWFGSWWKYGGGGTVWDSIVYDPELKQLYIGVGNGSPWNYQIRSDGKGDNLFLSSIVALDPETGHYIWHYQGTPGESYDFTHTQPIMLATLPIDGKPRKVLMQAPKNGFFYVIDRQTGKLISAKNFVPQTWADHIDLATGRPIFAANAKYQDGPKFITPSSLGGHNWMPMSFDPRLGLVFLPTMSNGLTYGQDPSFVYRPGRWNTGADLTPGAPPGPPPSPGALVAWDPVRQREVWRVEQPSIWNGGTLATAGGLVFQGNAQGRFNAYQSATGKLLWSFDGQNGIMGGPISYRIGNQDYVAVLAGRGGSAPLFLRQSADGQYPPINGRVLVFRLDGTAKLPKRSPADTSPPPPVTEHFSDAQVTAGRTLFWTNCYMCHGGSVLPNLRRSGALGDKDVWKSIVIDGALKDNGMASFRDYVTPEGAEQIRAYVASLKD